MSDGLIVDEGPRFWVDDNIDYEILFEGQPSDYVGLVDELAGGHIAYGVYQHINNLAAWLNEANPWPPMSYKKGRHERRIR